jgi:hypothetical protein
MVAPSGELCKAFDPGVSYPGSFAVLGVASWPMKLSARQGPLPFWIHQIVEYGLALVLASSGARMTKPVLPLTAAAVLILLAATADGPLAAVHVVRRPMHRLLDWVIGLGLIIAAAVFYRQAGSAPALLTGLVGFALLGLSWRTNYAPKPVRVRKVRRGRPSPATSVPAPIVAPAPTATVTHHAPVASAPLVPLARVTPQPPVIAPTAASAQSGPADVSVTDPDSLPDELAAESGPSSAGPAPLSRGAKAERVGRKAGKYAAVGVKVWRNRKQP